MQEHKLKTKRFFFQERSLQTLLSPVLFVFALLFLNPTPLLANGLSNNIPAYTPQSNIVQHSNINTLELQENEHKITWEGKNKVTQIKDLYVYEKDNFRIFYYTSGVDKVNPTDSNKNTVPDYIEDIAKQMWATQYVFCDVLGFHDPLSHYYEDVDFIDIFVLSADKLKGATGTTFTQATQAFLKPDGIKAVKILLSKGFHFASSTTITHEFFHVLQNSVSQIKNLWYLEGLARWSEDILHKKDFKRNPNWNYYKLIKNKDILNHVHALSYDGGKFFWIPFTIQMTKDKKFYLDKDHPLVHLKYSNNAPVLQDSTIAGAQFIKLFLANLARIDKQIIKDHKIKEWNEVTTRHKRNNSYLMQAISQSLNDMKAIAKKPVRAAITLKK